MPASGSVELRAISERLKAAGSGDVRLQMIRGLRVAAQPLVPAVGNAALRQLPKQGGLNQQVAGQKVTVSVSTAARTAGVRLKTTAPDTAMTDAGFVRHPLPRNNRSRWITQSIPAAAGWWSGTLQRLSPAITPALVTVMRTVAAQIEGG